MVKYSLKPDPPVQGEAERAKAGTGLWRLVGLDPVCMSDLEGQGTYK